MSELLKFINTQQFESEIQFERRKQLFREKIKSRSQIIEELVFSSWWASWLPFGWMHSLAAVHFSKKAERLYKAQFNSHSTSIQQ